MLLITRVFILFINWYPSLTDKYCRALYVDCSFDLHLLTLLLICWLIHHLWEFHNSKYSQLCCHIFHIYWSLKLDIHESSLYNISLASLSIDFSSSINDFLICLWPFYMLTNDNNCKICYKKYYMFLIKTTNILSIDGYESLSQNIYRCILTPNYKIKVL